jgi:hypothetical protein
VQQNRSSFSIESDQICELDVRRGNCHDLCMATASTSARVTVPGDVSADVRSADLTRRLAIDLGRTTAAACRR